MSCPEHKKYRAIRRPRLACEACWKMWFAAEATRSNERIHAQEKLAVESGWVELPPPTPAQPCMSGSYTCGGADGLCRDCSLWESEMRRG